MSEDLTTNRKVIIPFTKEYYHFMNQNIFVGARHDRNVRAITLLGIAVSLGGLVMTLINVTQHKGFVTFTTAAIAVLGLFMVFEIRVRKKRKPVEFTVMIIGLGIFTYYSLKGVNDGFAILWTLIVPIGVSFLIGAKHGIFLSIYYEILFICMFYTPYRENMAAYYSETFMNRYPVLYFVDAFVVFITVSSYQISNVTEIEYEARLREAADIAIQADKAKSRFLAQMSHEIRTPINAVLGMNEMILRESDNKDILEYAENISASGRNLLYIINSILDFSKIEDGKMEIIPVEYDLASVINNLVNSIKARAEARELELKVVVDRKLPSELFGDDVRFSQVVMNLLTNAVKYTERGSVTLTVMEKERALGNILIEVVVSDTGIGIRKEDMDKLFESFTRIDEKRNRGIEGTGLGMAIVTKLLDMMDSKLEVESEYGVGSRFSFVIRQKIIDETPIGDYTERYAKASGHMRSKPYVYAPDARILIVDDNEMNCKVVKNLLKRNGIVPDLAFSGAEAIGKIREHFYHIVFLDHMMPKMDGVETLGKLKEMDLIPEGTKIIVLTANAVVGAREKYLEDGFDDYLSKPVEITELEEKLLEFLPPEFVTMKQDVPEEEKPEPMTAPVFNDDAEDEVMEFSPSEDKEEAVQEDTAEKGDFLEELKRKGIDTEAALNYCGKDKEFYREVISEYTSTYAEKRASLDDFLKAEDMKEYRTLIHSVKSGSKTIGAMELSEKARLLEEASANGDLGYVKDNHAAFLREYSGMTKFLSDIVK
ncbi:MAG: response regulator [Lachnospiraceae bacterium]|nr:response regulator [Lachnospiraceae bacterium]